MKLILTFVGLLWLWACPAAALDIQGQWQQGALLQGRVEPGTRIYLDDRAVPVSPEGHFVIGLGRSAPTEVTLTREKDGQKSSRVYPVAQREYDIQRIEGVPQRTVTPPEDVLDRIRREAALVRKARADSDRRLDFLAGFDKPLEGIITGVYGSQRFYNGEPRSPHYGLDIAGPEGAVVKAPAPGVVRLVHDDMYFSGGTLIVDHGYGVSSSFIHLSDILVKEGQRVAAGDPIAKVGATGRATGPHLDWRINWYDVRIDPALVLEAFPRR